ncbi:Zinc finger protein 84-like 1, partial [Homarus americanus]
MEGRKGSLAFRPHVRLPMCLRVAKNDGKAPSARGATRAKMNLTVNPRLLKCEHCSYFTAKKHELITHMQTHTEDESFSCHHCHSQFSDKYALHRHLNLYCEKNGEISALIFTCNYCPFTTHKQSELIKHINSHSSQELSIVIHYCNFCSYSTFKKSYFLTHINTHTSERPYSCPYCACRFVQKSTLSRLRQGGPESANEGPGRGGATAAMKMVIPNISNVKLHQCPYCSYSTPRKNHLIEHIRTHTGEKPFACPYCPSRFVQKGTLNSHIRTHTGERPYACPICPQTFAQRTNLRTHLCTHLGKIPPSVAMDSGNLMASMGGASGPTVAFTPGSSKVHQCPHCIYSTARKHHLEDHIRTHTGEKPFACPHCPYRCSKSINLTTHIRIHTGKKPYVCTQCPFRTAQKVNLTRHSYIHTR